MPSSSRRENGIWGIKAPYFKKESGAFFAVREVNAMNFFEEVKQNVTTRQAAKFYGVTVSRNGMNYVLSMRTGIQA